MEAEVQRKEREARKAREDAIRWREEQQRTAHIEDQNRQLKIQVKQHTSHLKLACTQLNDVH